MAPIIEVRNLTKQFGGCGNGHRRRLRLVRHRAGRDRLPGRRKRLRQEHDRAHGGRPEATSGEVIFEGKNIKQLDSAAFRRYRQTVQIIHQDPYSSLNPTQTIRQIITRRRCCVTTR